MKRLTLIAISSLTVIASTGVASAEGDAAEGAVAFKACRTCHQIGPDARNFVGPELNGVVGRKAGTVPGYNYSDADKSSGLIWDEATLTKFLHSPRQVVPGTKMAFPGFDSDSDVANLIAYLKQFSLDGKTM